MFACLSFAGGISRGYNVCHGHIKPKYITSFSKDATRPIEMGAKYIPSSTRGLFQSLAISFCVEKQIWKWGLKEASRGMLVAERQYC